MKNIDVLTESIKKNILFLFESIRKTEDNLVKILYHSSTGDIKFMNNTYDFNQQIYKVYSDKKISLNDYEKILTDFIEEKTPDILIFNEIDTKKLKPFLEKNKFEFNDGKFYFKDTN